MKTPLSGLKAIIPFTPRGLFFFCLSVIFFITGLFRADLAALFWGCGFLLLTLYAFSGNHIFKILIKRYFKNHTQSVNICFSETGIIAGTPASVHINIQLPSFFVPGFTLKLLLVLQWQTREPLSLQTILLPGKNTIDIPFTGNHRGKYSCECIRYCIEDFFGFTKADYAIKLEEYIYIFPRLVSREDLMFKVTGEESTDVQKKRRSNDELLEVKKYYPGDDVRKLNWKIFAHTGELFVRKGEETPPPDSKFLFILDPTVTPFISSSFSNDFLDSLVEIIGSIMIMILDKGNILYLSIPGSNQVFTCSQKQKINLLTLLSCIWWIPEQKKIRMPGKQKMHALVFSSPGSLSLPHIVKELKTRNWNMSLFLKNYIFPYFLEKDFLKKDFNIKRLLFIPEKKSQGKKRFLPDLFLFKQALYSEIERYKTAPWRIQDVREI